MLSTNKIESQAIDITQILLKQALRFTDASTLAPLVYVELVATIFIGYIVFSEIPNVSTAIGAACIILSGLLLFRTKGGRS